MCSNHSAVTLIANHVNYFPDLHRSKTKLQNEIQRFKEMRMPRLFICVSLEDLKVRDHIGGIGVDKRILLKY
jgi:hypothetical protein